VANLCLSIGAHDTHILLKWLPLCLLLIRAHVINRELKHGKVQNARALAKHIGVKVRLVTFVVNKPFLLIQFICSSGFLDRIFYLLFATHFIEFVAIF